MATIGRRPGVMVAALLAAGALLAMAIGAGAGAMAIGAGAGAGAAAQSPRGPLASAFTANSAAVTTQGKLVFQQRCARCHTIERGRPDNLRGVFNAGAGQRPGTWATATLKYSGKIWNAAQLDRFLADPARDLPGTTMQGAALHDAAERHAVIAYLMTLQ